MKRLKFGRATGFKLLVFAFIAIGFVRVMRDDGGLSIRGMEVIALVAHQFDRKNDATSKQDEQHSAAMPDIIRGKAQVYSGDTFDLIYQATVTQRYRQLTRIHLDGVDACESRQSAIYDNIKWPCGAVATAWLVAKTMGKQVSCHPSRIDRSGRYFATCFVDGVDLARSGLTDGIMIVDRHRDGDTIPEYEKAEASARSLKKGLWSGQFDDPQAFRKQNGSYNPFEPTNR